LNSHRRLVLSLLGLGAAVVRAQTPWPSRPIRLIVADSSTSATDTVARLTGARIAPTLGQPVLVENRAGANGTLGVDAAAKAADGYTFVLASMRPLTLSPHLSRSPFDPLKDIVPVARVMYAPIFLAATPSFTGKTFGDMIELARASPGQLRFATAGVGSAGHVMIELIKRRAQIDIRHIPYKSGALLAHDAAGGHFDLLASDPNAALADFIAQGRLRVLAVGAPERIAGKPGVATLAELGYREANLSSWFGVFAAAGVATDIVRRMHAEISHVLQTKDMQERLAKIDHVASPASGEQFRAQIEAEYFATGRVIREAGIRAG
jgi:tripartite-type tricarboxylate transporter receptor subunit TctC